MFRISPTTDINIEINIVHLCFYTSERGSNMWLIVMFFPFPFKCWKGKVCHCLLGTAGGLMSMQCELIKSWGRLLTLLMQACVWPLLFPSNSVFSLLSLASRSVSDVSAIWSGSTSVDILLQSRESSSFCVVSHCPPRHLPWFKTLSHAKKGSPLFVSIAKCDMLYSILKNII